MNYNFVKIKDNRTGLEYPWILECKDIETLIEHTDKCMDHTIREGVQDWFDKTKNSIKLSEDYRYKEHFTTEWAGMCETFAKMRGEHFIQSSATLENKVMQAKILSLFKYGTLYLREIGSYMMHCDGFEITDRMVSETLVYPGYSEKDIRITKWPGGSHYYAKIGKMDVIDEHGNQKWNTHAYAMNAALKELKNL